MIEVIKNKEDWDKLIKTVEAFDFYSTYEYHDLSKLEGEIPVLIKYSQDDAIIGLPLLIRKIGNSKFYDATSVYGYAGPISKNISAEFDNRKYKEELDVFFQENDIATVFSRLNPYIAHQDVILNSVGQTIVKGEIVMIDLLETLEIQRRQYQKRMKSQINRARTLCTVRKAETKEDISIFMDLYYENMNRVDAKEYYYFNEDYFAKFMQNDNCEVDILLATLNETDTIISGAIFMKSNDIIQYHLSGTKSDYMDIGALKLILDEMRIQGTEEGYKLLNLGGGLNCNDDSLLRFKKSFSKTTRQFSVWEYVVNEQIYNELCKPFQQVTTEFFPKYRCAD